MAKEMYVGVEGVSRDVKAGYVGVDGVARRFTPDASDFGATYKYVLPVGSANTKVYVIPQLINANGFIGYCSIDTSHRDTPYVFGFYSEDGVTVKETYMKYQSDKYTISTTTAVSFDPSTGTITFNNKIRNGGFSVFYW